MVAPDVPYADGHAAELDVEPIAKHDVGWGNPNLARRGQLLLDVGGVPRGDQAGGDAALERLVTPIGNRELGQRVGRKGLRDDVSADLGRSKDVIPMGVREGDVAWRR